MDLFAFGSRQAPRAPRPIKDVPLDSAGRVISQGGYLPEGASTYGDPMSAPLSGHYHRLPAGTSLPEGLEALADGSDVLPDGPHGPSHHTIYATASMTFDTFAALFLGLPWTYGGKK